MVAKIKNLLSMESWTTEDSISFESITDNSYYDWYKNGYEEFHNDYPELRSKVTVEFTFMKS